MKKGIWAILALVILAGCKSSKLTTTEVKTETVIERSTDTLIQIIETTRFDTLYVRDSVVLYLDAETGQTKNRESYHDEKRVSNKDVVSTKEETREKEAERNQERQKVTIEETKDPPNRKTFADILWIWTGKALSLLFVFLAGVGFVVYLIRKVIPSKLIKYVKRLF